MLPQVSASRTARRNSPRKVQAQRGVQPVTAGISDTVPGWVPSVSAESHLAQQEKK